MEQEFERNEICMRIITAIREMPREAFLERIFRSIAKTRQFSELVTFGAESLPEEDREELWLALQGAGVPTPCAKLRREPEPLDAAAAAITARAVTLR